MNFRVGGRHCDGLRNLGRSSPLHLTQLLMNLPSWPVRDLDTWLPDPWKLHYTARLANLSLHPPPPLLNPRNNPCAPQIAHETMLLIPRRQSFARSSEDMLRVLSPKLDGRVEGWYGFRRGFGQNFSRHWARNGQGGKVNIPLSYRNNEAIYL